jgi:hypothetical protein
MVANVDRLSRKVHFFSGLMKHRVWGANIEVGKRSTMASAPQHTRSYGRLEIPAL